jgi:hypothetical protein
MFSLNHLSLPEVFRQMPINIIPKPSVHMLGGVSVQLQLITLSDQSFSLLFSFYFIFLSSPTADARRSICSAPVNNPLRPKFFSSLLFLLHLPLPSDFIVPSPLHHFNLLPFNFRFPLYLPLLSLCTTRTCCYGNTDLCSTKKINLTN